MSQTTVNNVTLTNIESILMNSKILYLFIIYFLKFYTRLIIKMNITV